MRLDLEQSGSQVGHKIHRHPPTQQQRHHGHRKDGEGVLTGHRARRADGQETRRGDERAGQHGHGGDFVGKGGCTHLVVALLHLAHHHLHRNDGVVHEQAQGDDERAQGYLVQPDPKILHEQKCHRQHQRNRDAHHQTRSQVDVKAPAPAFVQAQRQDTHGQHNHHGLDQHANKLIH